MVRTYLRSGTLLLFFFMSCFMAFAQKITVKGTVV